MNGIFLLAVGAIWNEVRLSSLLSKIAYWALLSGTYGNWVVTTTAAILGTAALSPITAGGHSAAPVWEVLVTTGFVLIGLAIIFASSLLLWGLRGTVKALPS
jgi:hydroxylaminobenzene mutase